MLLAPGKGAVGNCASRLQATVQFPNLFSLFKIFTDALSVFSAIYSPKEEGVDPTSLMIPLLRSKMGLHMFQDE